MVDNARQGAEMASAADASQDAPYRDSRAAQFHSYSAFQAHEAERWLQFVPNKASGLSTRQVETLAEGLASELNYQAGMDIRELVVRVGGRLLSTSSFGINGAPDGTLFIRSDSTEFLITVSARASSRQDQLSVAKALGHYFLHHRFFQIEPDPKPTRAAPARAEREALLFALAFLMPTEAFQRALTLASGKIELVAASFGVPFEAANHRYRRLRTRVK